MKKLLTLNLRAVIGVVVTVVISVAIIWYVKFTLVQDDIHLQPSVETISAETITGAWIQEPFVDGGQSIAQGFELFSDGYAQSINMATLLYKSWRLTGDRLTFRVESIGNGLSFENDETYTIQALKPDLSRMTLVSSNGQTIHYIKEPIGARTTNPRY